MDKERLQYKKIKKSAKIINLLFILRFPIYLKTKYKNKNNFGNNNKNAKLNSKKKYIKTNPPFFLCY